MIELQPSASLGTLRVVVFGRGDRECREWVKPPREPHAIQTVRSCNRYATCLTCSSSLSGSSLPISRFSYPLLLCPSPDSPDLHGHTPRTLTPRFSRSPRLIPSRFPPGVCWVRERNRDKRPQKKKKRDKDRPQDDWTHSNEYGRMGT